MSSLSPHNILFPALILASFVQLHDLGCFEVEAIEDFDALGMEKEVIHLHRITMKKPS